MLRAVCQACRQGAKAKFNQGIWPGLHRIEVESRSRCAEDVQMSEYSIGYADLGGPGEQERSAKLMTGRAFASRGLECRLTLFRDGFIIRLDFPLFHFSIFPTFHFRGLAYIQIPCPNVLPGLFWTGSDMIASSLITKGSWDIQFVQIVPTVFESFKHPRTVTHDLVM